MPHPPPDPWLCLTLTLFGGLSVRCADWAVDELPPQQKASLLAYLALAGYRATSRQELIDLLWPESVPEKASQNLRQCLHSLRLLLEQPPFASGSVLWANRTEIRLNPNAIRTDVIAFEGAIEAAKRTMERRERIASLAHAADLYRGELLPGFYQDRIVSERHRLAEVHQQALHLLVREMEAEGDLDRALHYARRATLLNPLSEPACCALMRVYAALGEPSAVLRGYQEWEARHIKEFGEPPHDGSRATAQQWQQAARQKAALRQESPCPPVLVSRPDAEIEVTALSAAETTVSLSTSGPTEAGVAQEPSIAPVVASRDRRLPAFAAAIGLSLLLLAWFVHVGSISRPRSRAVGPAPRPHSSESLPRKAGAPLTASVPTAPRPTKKREATPNPHGRPTRVRIASTLAHNRSSLRTNASNRPRRPGETHGFPISQSKPLGPPADLSPPTSSLPIVAGSPPEAGPGEAQWTRYYPLKPGDKDDQPTAMTTDSAGNIYITGFVNTSKTDVDYQTLKYSPEGQLLWEQRYNGPGNDLDRAKAIAVDADGCVYVTGESDGGKGHGPDHLSGLDIATIKYGPDGRPSTTWPDVGFGVGVRRYVGQADGRDSGAQIGLDSAGNIFVFGQSWGGSSSEAACFDLVLLKYTRDGTQRWARRYPTGSGSDAAARGMVLDPVGGIYVTAAVHHIAKSGDVSTEPEVLTLKYDEAGNVLWQQRDAGPAQQKAEPTCIALDRASNVFVAGFCRTGFTGSIPREEYLLLKYDPNGSLIWAKNYSWHQYMDRPWGAAVDSKGRIYVTGEIQLPGEANAFGTLMYDGSGRCVWAESYYGSSTRSTRSMGATMGRALALNSLGECYVTGSTWYMDPLRPNLGAFDRREYATLRYDAKGVRSRPMRHRGRDLVEVNQGPNCIVVDENDNVIVTGQITHDNRGSMVIVKYRP